MPIQIEPGSSSKIRIGAFGKTVSCRKSRAASAGQYSEARARAAQVSLISVEEEKVSGKSELITYTCYQPMKTERAKKEKNSDYGPICGLRAFASPL